MLATQHRTVNRTLNQTLNLAHNQTLNSALNRAPNKIANRALHPAVKKVLAKSFMLYLLGAGLGLLPAQAAAPPNATPAKAASNAPPSLVTLPAAPNLQNLMKSPPQVFRVIEPHLSLSGQQVKRDYVCYPAAAVFSALLGRNWADQKADIEFRATDGYVSRIETSRFKKYRAYLVFAIKDQADFTVDNPGQNEKRVPLGPYYLIWDNVRSPELLKEEAADWPYQVNQIAISTQRREALLPGKLDQRFTEQAALAQKHCLTCHQVNGYGGDKWPINLAVQAKSIKEEAFIAWVLNPSAQKAGTTMPPLLVSLPEEKRQAQAKKIYQYLRALPVKAD
jgi:mono/diheme cytochrome c family protein